MASPLTAYRVFIASPGGLGPERERFKTIVNKYNDDNIDRGLYFLPFGWESTLGGIGRPQELVNEDIRRSDYLILVLWDRWGTPPNNETEKGDYTSGTEEEYHVAIKCLLNETSPMQQIVVFFKAIDHQKLSDPGPGLVKVLNFKKRLEAEKNLLFYTFDDGTVFDDKIRAHLASWTRDHEKGLNRKKQNIESNRVASKSIPLFLEGSSTPPIQLERSSTSLAAEKLANEERYTESEMLFAQAIARGDDPDPINSYGTFLRLMGRYDQAESILNMATKWGVQHDQAYWVGVSYNGLAALNYDRGKYSRAILYAKKALRILEQNCGSEDLGLADSLDHIGIIYLAQGKYSLAQSALKRAIMIREKISGPQSLDYARSLNNLAGLYRAQNLFALAEPLYKQTLDILQKAPGRTESEITRSLHGLGITYYNQAKYSNAEPLLIKALEITQETLVSDHPLVARSKHDLGMLYNAQEKFAEAEPLLKSALEIAEKALGALHPSIAFGLVGLAQLYICQRKYDQAKPLIFRALKIREEVLGLEHPLIVPVLACCLKLYKPDSKEAADVKLRLEKLQSKLK